jgi:hypothetical protein
MMPRMIWTALLLFAATSICCAANAATLSFRKSGDAYVVFLDGGSTEFDTIEVSIPSRSPQVFTNITSGQVAGVPRPPGQQFTYYNRMLNADPLDIPGALGWTFLETTVTPTEVLFVGGPVGPGQRIDTSAQPGGRLFLANLMPGAAMARAEVLLYSNRSQMIVERLNAFMSLDSIPPDLEPFVPEPLSGTMAGIGLVVVVAAARRRNA